MPSLSLSTLVPPPPPAGRALGLRLSEALWLFLGISLSPVSAWRPCPERLWQSKAHCRPFAEGLRGWRACLGGLGVSPFTPCPGLRGSAGLPAPMCWGLGPWGSHGHLASLWTSPLWRGAAWRRGLLVTTGAPRHAPSPAPSELCWPVTGRTAPCFLGACEVGGFLPSGRGGWAGECWVFSGSRCRGSTAERSKVVSPGKRSARGPPGAPPRASVRACERARPCRPGPGTRVGSEDAAYPVLAPEPLAGSRVSAALEQQGDGLFPGNLGAEGGRPGVVSLRAGAPGFCLCVRVRACELRTLCARCVECACRVGPACLL